MLRDILPARYRKTAYALYALAVVVFGALAAAQVNTGHTTDVLAYLGGALGFVAASNTGTAAEDKSNEAGAVDTLLLVAVAVLVVVLLILFGVKPR